jgi:transposase
MHIPDAILVSCPSILAFVSCALQVQRLLPTSNEVLYRGKTARISAKCPVCGLSSARIHGRYLRILRDLPWQGRSVKIRVAARRFRCINIACARKTFAERLGDVGAGQALLDLPWTTSPVEGQINRLEMLKRTMYSRAGFALLRIRVLNAA